MDKVTSPKLGDLKLRLKKFEHDFFHANNRKPTENDIKRDKNIFAMYKSYNSLSKKPEPIKKPSQNANLALTRMKRPVQESPTKSARCVKRFKTTPAPISSSGFDFDSPSKFVNARIGGISPVKRQNSAPKYVPSPEKSPVKPLIRRSSSFRLPAMFEHEIDEMLGLVTSDQGEKDESKDTEDIETSTIPEVVLQPFATTICKPKNIANTNYQRINLKKKSYSKGKGGPRGSTLRRQTLKKKFYKRR